MWAIGSAKAVHISMACLPEASLTGSAHSYSAQSILGRAAMAAGLKSINISSSARISMYPLLHAQILEEVWSLALEVNAEGQRSGKAPHQISSHGIRYGRTGGREQEAETSS